jgi:hypothetical protein
LSQQYSNSRFLLRNPFNQQESIMQADIIGIDVKTIGKMKLAELRALCEEFGIALVGDRRLKATYIQALETWISAQEAAQTVPGLVEVVQDLAVDIKDAVTDERTVTWAKATTKFAGRLLTLGFYSAVVVGAASLNLGRAARRKVQQLRERSGATTMLPVAVGDELEALLEMPGQSVALEPVELLRETDR